MNSFLKKLLDFLGMNDGDLLSRSSSGKDISEVTNIVEFPEEGAVCSSFGDFQKALNFLKETVKDNSPVVVYGDYDVDGLTSTSIMAMTLRLLGVKKVGFFIPSRYDNGYGLSLPVLEKMVKNGYQRLIAVDNGITKKDEISYLLSKGLKVLVLDHHEEQKLSFPPFDGKDAVLYHRNDVSAAFLALLVSERLLDSKEVNVPKKDSYLRYFFTLASLAVFSDCMSLKNSHNLALAKIGLKNLNEGYADRGDPCHDFYKNLVKLTDKESGNPLTFKDINFSINSKLNALARMKGGTVPNLGSFYLQGQVKHRDIDIHEFIEGVSNEKRSLVNKVKNENTPADKGGFYLLDLSSDQTIPSGLSGLLANSLMDKYHLKKPILVLCPSTIKQDDVIASFRSTKSYSLDKIIDSPLIRPLLKDHGGHAQACGFTIERREIPALMTALNQSFKDYDVSKEEEKYLPISVEEIGEECFNAFDLLEPFGQDFEKPVLGFPFSKDELLKGLRGEHIFYPLPDGSHGERRRITYFQGNKALNRIKGDQIILKGEMEKNVFRGSVTYVFRVKECKEKV